MSLGFKNYRFKFIVYYFQGILAQMDRFKRKLETVPQAPRSTSEIDAIGTLLDICVQRSWPLPK